MSNIVFVVCSNLSTRPYNTQPHLANTRQIATPSRYWHARSITPALCFDEYPPSAPSADPILQGNTFRGWNATFSANKAAYFTQTALTNILVRKARDTKRKGNGLKWCYWCFRHHNTLYPVCSMCACVLFLRYRLLGNLPNPLMTRLGDRIDVCRKTSENGRAC